MPADRTKALKGSDSGNEVVWAPQFDSMAAAEVSFTANVTPFDFSSDDPPPLVDPPTEFIMFPPNGESTMPRRQPHSKKKPENHIPRPPNAFILFRSSFIKGQHVSTGVETNHSTLSKIIGLTWQNLPDQERQIWHQKAKEALEEHKRRFPKYAFRPVQTKAKGAASEKRKVREVEPKDEKRCKKIAQLLVQGKRRESLEDAVKEFDKTHVPEIVTRFEAPITARSYRRSSSAPIPDTENALTQKSFLQTVVDVPKRKVRAASTRPTRCSTPATFHDQASSPDSSASPIVDMQALPLKDESSFNFGGFSFASVASPAPSFDCDPLGTVDNVGSFDETQFNPGLTIDTNFMSLNDWAPSPSSMSPETPNYMMSPVLDPVICSSPSPSFNENFDHFDQPQKHFEEFNSFPGVFHQSCAAPQQQAGICGGGTTEPIALYAAYAQHQQQLGLGNLDLDFSTFMNGIPQYAI